MPVSARCCSPCCRHTFSFFFLSLSFFVCISISFRTTNGRKMCFILSLRTRFDSCAMYTPSGRGSSRKAPSKRRSWRTPAYLLQHSSISSLLLLPPIIFSLFPLFHPLPLQLHLPYENIMLWFVASVVSSVFFNVSCFNVLNSPSPSTSLLLLPLSYTSDFCSSTDTQSAYTQSAYRESTYPESILVWRSQDISIPSCASPAAEQYK